MRCQIMLYFTKEKFFRSGRVKVGDQLKIITTLCQIKSNRNSALAAGLDFFLSLNCEVFAFYEKKFSPLRHKDTKKDINQSFHFVSWCLCGNSFRFIRVRIYASIYLLKTSKPVCPLFCRIQAPDGPQRPFQTGRFAGAAL